MYTLLMSEDFPWRCYILKDGGLLIGPELLPVCFSDDETFGEAAARPDNAEYIRKLQELIDRANVGTPS
jgi:hypothetical protein